VIGVLLNGIRTGVGSLRSGIQKALGQRLLPLSFRSHPDDLAGARHRAAAATPDSDILRLGNVTCIFPSLRMDIK
jgi:hypothetical protein